MSISSHKPEQWSSRFGFLMAAVGAAVGLGNIWKFPYVAGLSGGGAFVLVYLLAVLLVALPILMAEVALGRWGRKSPPKSMEIIAENQGRSRTWAIAGWLGMLSAYLIASFYCVIAGWSVAYIFKAANGDFSGQGAESINRLFDELLADPVAMTFWHGLFVLVCALILSKGIQKGVERAAKILMPLLFILLLAMVIYGAIEGDMPAAAKFLFSFDFSAITPEVVVLALGQAFFSIGVAIGLMMIYGAYLPREVSIGRSALIIAGMDTAVALIAGLAIFPIVFAHGLDSAEGPGLIFVSLPIAFGAVTGGVLFGTLFFILLFFAALTSVIGAVEPMISWWQERFNLARWKAAALVSGSIFLLGICTVWSFNLWSGWRPLAAIEKYSEYGYFDLLVHITTNVMMPLGGLLLAIFTGWMIKPEAIARELNIKNQALFRAWFWLIRWLAPISISAILITGL